MVSFKHIVAGGVFILLFAPLAPHYFDLYGQEMAEEIQEDVVQEDAAPPGETPDSPDDDGVKSAETADGDTTREEEIEAVEEPSDGQDDPGKADVEEVVEGDVLSIPAQSEPEVPVEGPVRYEVREGDTLWDISFSQLDDPFLWPKLWKVNRTIPNPDLIYPGLILELPRELLPAAPEFVTPVPEEEPQVTELPAVAEQEPPEEPAFVEREIMEEPEAVPPVEEKVSAPERPSFETNYILKIGYILPRQTATGVVIGAKDLRVMLSERDLIYGRVDPGVSVNIGDRLTVFNRVKKVYHPKTKDYLGQLVRIKGLIQVTAVQEKTVSAKIITSFEPVYRGDELVPYVEPALPDMPRSVSSHPESIKGYIVEVKEPKVLHGDHDVVYLDMGNNHGVMAGDRFNITRPGLKTPLLSPGKGVQLPGYVVGQVEVVVTQDQTATARILDATEAIRKGDRIESP